jgi:hypothetical protein
MAAWVAPARDAARSNGGRRTRIDAVGSGG